MFVIEADPSTGVGTVEAKASKASQPDGCSCGAGCCWVVDEAKSPKSPSSITSSCTEIAEEIPEGAIEAAGSGKTGGGGAGVDAAKASRASHPLGSSTAGVVDEAKSPKSSSALAGTVI